MKTKKFPWKSVVRRESGLVELIDDQGVGHPSFWSIHWMAINGMDGFGIHGCNGKCRTPEWKLADAQQGVQIANELLFDAHKKIKGLEKQLEDLRRLLDEANEKAHTYSNGMTEHLRMYD